MDQKYEVMPELTTEEYESLKEDIKKRGVMVPIEIDERGAVLDGYNRVRICQELGITDFPTIVREGMTEEEKYEQALQLNVRRRHLSGEQLKEVIRDFKAKHPEASDRQVAKAVGVSNHTVASAETEEFAGGQTSHLQNVQGTDGKSYPASEAQVEKQRRDIQETIKKNPDMNNHQIAQSLGVSDHTVERQREKVSSEDGDDFSKPIQDEIYDDADRGEDEKLTLKNETAEGNDTVSEEEDQDSDRTMTPCEDLELSFRDVLNELTTMLDVLLNDYKGNSTAEELLFSDEGIEASLKGLKALKEIIEKYERIVKERKSEPGKKE